MTRPSPPHTPAHAVLPTPATSPDPPSPPPAPTPLQPAPSNAFSSSSSSLLSLELETEAEEEHKRWMNEKARDLNHDWVNEDELVVFEKALLDEPSEMLISAVNDFAPIKLKTGPKRRRDIVREGWAYHVSRWPLLGIILLVIFWQFVGYLFVRQCVNIFEYFSSWRGHRGKLRLALRNATSYTEWKSRALALDDHLHYTDWKRSSPNAYYDSSLIRRVLRSLREMRAKGDVQGLRAVLEVALKSNFAGTESPRLYSETFLGTKELVEVYLDEVAESLAYIRSLPPSVLSLDEKSRFFRHTSKNLGASALCLSGGASFGYYHFGVVRALVDANLLPRIIAGTSAGAIVAAFACTRTDDELREMIREELAGRINVCRDPFLVWILRAWRTGARFDAIDWARKASFFTMGSMTFLEAYERTGRILNVSVIPYDMHSPTKLLNYITAPDCVIYSAVIASAAVPGILNPVVLLTKNKDGSVHPWEFEGKHKDGSLRVDIPLQFLNLLYNVNFSIVSQVNPHIHLFHFDSRGAPGRPVSHRKGKGWRGGFFLSAAEQFLKLELTKNFRVIRDLELLPELGGQNWSAVFLQRFDGTVNIFPKSRARDWFRILADPDPEELGRMIMVGQRSTWPKIRMIENRMKIERQLDLGRLEVFQAQQALLGLSTSTPTSTTDSTTTQRIPPLSHSWSFELPTSRSLRTRTRSSKRPSTSTRTSTTTPTNVDGEERIPFSSRRKEIIANLGLADDSSELSADGGSRSSTPLGMGRSFADLGLTDGTDGTDDSEVERYVGRGGLRGRGAQVRRRFGMGTVRFVERGERAERGSSESEDGGGEEEEEREGLL